MKNSIDFLTFIFKWWKFGNEDDDNADICEQNNVNNIKLIMIINFINEDSNERYDELWK